MSKASRIRFDEMTDIHKQCPDPSTNPTFGRDQVPIMEYISQFSKKNRNEACRIDTSPFLVWNREKSKYCCSPEPEQDTDYVLEKIEDAIRTQVANSCDKKLYNKYKGYIDFFIANYIKIYKNKLLLSSEPPSPEMFNELVQQKRDELAQLATYHEDDEQSASCDMGEDDEELMARLRLAEQTGPNARGSHFFDTEGGFSKKKSRKSRKRKNYRRSRKARN
jgi:hypothetical protein